MKKIATMQDISCVGKCSLTVALPILSGMGIETAVLPTAVLSTHTAFEGYTFCDLTKEIRPILKHWEKENFKFNALYTGYLGSFEQLAIASELFDTFGKDIPKLVDPCMGDNGKLYPGFDEAFALEMSKLCAKADYICPNLTEACFLLHIPYKENFSKQEIEDILIRLSKLGSSKVVLTGISFHKDELGVYGYDSSKNKFYDTCLSKLTPSFHGTGDIWASTFIGAITLGRRFEVALDIATDYTHACIARTIEEKNHSTYGVNFEEEIPYLVQKLHAR